MKPTSTPRVVGRRELRDLVDRDGVVVVEVLPREEHEWARLPGALPMPLPEWTVDVVRRRLDASQPVVVYCNDFL